MISDDNLTLRIVVGVNAIVATILFLFVPQHSTAIYCYLHDRIEKSFFFKTRFSILNSHNLPSQTAKTNSVTIQEKAFDSSQLTLVGSVLAYTSIPLFVILALAPPVPLEILFLEGKIIFPEGSYAWFFAKVAFVMYACLLSVCIMFIKPNVHYVLRVEQENGEIIKTSFFNKRVSDDVKNEILKRVKT